MASRMNILHLLLLGKSLSSDRLLRSSTLHLSACAKCQAWGVLLGEKQRHVSAVATTSPSPAVQNAQLNATTSSSDPRLIVLHVPVDDASRPLRALLDSMAWNHFSRAESLPFLTSQLRVLSVQGR
ncbi:unnamed protein product [Peronospora belbahrii]|uniref:Uncharacterized protein n=1 Tax=Peronospora belbahrii TaxID=622444 RepID=A0AAU9L2V8_9STRA|nr:unnamed protein product [Peronospora belbahrii]